MWPWNRISTRLWRCSTRWRRNMVIQYCTAQGTTISGVVFYGIPKRTTWAKVRRVGKPYLEVGALVEVEGVRYRVKGMRMGKHNMVEVWFNHVDKGAACG